MLSGLPVAPWKKRHAPQWALNLGLPLSHADILTTSPLSWSRACGGFESVDWWVLHGIPYGFFLFFQYISVVENVVRKQLTFQSQLKWLK